ncbi:MAG: S9 family peptidase [Bacillota bacterium]
MTDSPEQRRRIVTEDLWRLRFVGDPQVSPDGSRVAFVVTETDVERDGYRSEIWVAQTDDPRSAGPFTNPVGEDWALRDTSPRWSPDGKKLAFLSNRGGKSAIWCIDAGGGEAEQLGSFAPVAGGVAWSPSGDRIAFSAMPPEEDGDEEKEPGVDVYVTRNLRYKFNGRGLLEDDRKMHIWVMKVDTGEVTQLTDAPSDDHFPAWSPDGTTVFFTSDRRPELEMRYIQDLYAVSSDGSELRRITEGQGPVMAPRPSSTGDLIAFFGHREGDCMTANTELYLMSPDGNEWTSLTSEFDRHVGNSVGADARFDAGEAAPAWCEWGLVFSLTDGGCSRLYRVDLKGNHRALEGFPPVITSYSVNREGEPVVAAVGADSDTPGDLWVLRPGGDPVQFTDLNAALFEEIELSMPERIRFPGAEGWEIEGWLMKPVGFEEGKKYPLVLEIHGGPAGTSGEAFFHEYQLLAAAGFGVIYANPRGSTGYGRRHAEGVIGDWGGNDYRDLMAAVDFACEQDWVDSGCLGVTGGSYGGYMTNWIVSQTDRFTAAVTFRSISNLYTKYGCSDIGFYGNRRGMGGADLWDSEDFIMSRSPIRYAPQVVTPILIVQSEEDLRCPMEQAEQWYVALKRLGVECEFVRYRDENHELSRSGRPHNRRDRLNRLIQWFDRYLGED